MALINIAVSMIEYTKSDNGPIVHVFGRDKERVRWHIRVYNSFPYFYVNELETITRNPDIIKIQKMPGWQSITQDNVKKIIMRLPEDVGGNQSEKEGFREKFKITYEDDIGYTSRFSIDNKIKSGIRIPNDIIDLKKDTIIPIEFKQDLRRIHLDIETSGRETKGRFPSIRHPINRIYCITTFDNYLNEFVCFVFHKTYKNKAIYNQKYEIPNECHGFGFKDTYPLAIQTYDNEKDMLYGFIEYFADKAADIGTGWNARKFDFPYIISRARFLKVNINKLSPLFSVWLDNKNDAHVKGLIVFDTGVGYKTINTKEKESWKIDFVAHKIFGVGKIGHGGIDDDYERNRNRLIKYNVQDVFLDYAIGENQKIFQFFYDVKCYVGCSYEDVLNNSRIVDTYMLLKAAEANLVLPSKRNRDEEGRSRGAIVLEPPSAGVSYWVVVFDLASLYPNCFLSLNIGADTLVLNPTEEEMKNLIKSPVKGVYFRKDKKSFLARIILELLQYRDKMKEEKERYKKMGDDNMKELYDRIQTVVKFITNSIFGVMGFNAFRLYDKRVFDNILATARIVISFSIEIVQRLGYKLLYGDTDSIFVLMKGRTMEDVEKEGAILVDELNTGYKLLNKVFNTDNNTFKMKIDKKFKSIMMVKKMDSDEVGKKHYAGILFDDSIEIVGFDRSDMSICGNTIMKKVLEMGARGQANEIPEYLRDQIKQIKTNKYHLDDISFSKGISQDFSEYKVKGNWVKAAEWTNKHSHLWGAQTNYRGGSKPKFVFVVPRLLPKIYEKTELVALDEFNNLPAELVRCIDWDRQIESTIKKKVMQILDAVGLNWDTIFSTHKVNRIGSF
jgi:DNA polymerase, archaea type